MTLERIDWIDCRDALEGLRELPDGCADLVLTDPPYNVGVTTSRAGKKVVNAWDRIDNYTEWSLAWLKECQRVLKPNGVLYFWHNDIGQVAELLEAIKRETSLALESFCIWDKGPGYRAQTWKNRDPNGKTALRSWFNICEYCLHFFNAPKDADGAWKHTGLERINSNPACYKPIKDWYAAEKERLGLTERDIAAAYTAATGRKPYMLRHYFKDTQFEIPTQATWEAVYMPMGFGASYEELRAYYEEFRASYEAFRASYEELRNTHNVDAEHYNIWHVPPLASTGRLHTCQKPTQILERLIRVSSNEGGIVLDPFMGSGSTAVAAMHMGRHYIGFERDPDYYRIAMERIRREELAGIQTTMAEMAK